MAYEIQRADQEIDEVRNKAADGMDQGSQFPGMSYEEGIDTVLRWLFGEADDGPFD